MAKKQVKLRVMRSTTVHAVNGKAYRLNAGENTLELEYADYVALAKALGFKPLPEDKKEDAPVKKVVESAKELEPVKESQTEEMPTPAKENYSLWNIVRLKQEYKRRTGKVCRLKKDEIVKFLQEQE